MIRYCVSYCTTKSSVPVPTNSEIDQIFKVLLIPRAVEMLKIISSSDQGMGFNEIINRFGLSSTNAYRVILPLTECGLIFYASERYKLNPLGRGALEAISILEDAVRGEDVVVFDISHPQREKVIELMDNITRN